MFMPIGLACSGSGSLLSRRDNRENFGYIGWQCMPCSFPHCVLREAYTYTSYFRQVNISHLHRHGRGD